MNKKELITPFLVATLSLLFVAICFMVLIKGGRSEKWIVRKMKIGGLLLTLTAASCHGNGGGTVTCYEVVEPNSMWISSNSQSGIEINLDTGNVLYGSISSIQGKDFSFLVTDSTSAKFQSGNIVVDDKPQSYTQNLKIELDKNLKPGKYLLRLYTAKPENQDTMRARREFNLIVKDE